MCSIVPSELGITSKCYSKYNSSLTRVVIPVADSINLIGIEIRLLYTINIELYDALIILLVYMYII